MPGSQEPCTLGLDASEWPLPEEFTKELLDLGVLTRLVQYGDNPLIELTGTYAALTEAVKEYWAQDAQDLREFMSTAKWPPTPRGLPRLDAMELKKLRLQAELESQGIDTQTLLGGL